MCDNLDDYIGQPLMSIVEAMQKIDKNSKGLLFITDDDNRLIASLTDGDIRRWLIKTGSLNADIASAMFKNPKYITEKNVEDAEKIMREYELTALPVLDDEYRVKDIIFSAIKPELSSKQQNSSLEGVPVIIMAGGKGTRLYPYTQILPKPLIPIGDIPILERIINRFCEYGVDEYYFTVNYKKGMIKSYFKELAPEYKIHYVEEEVPLGTAGSIKLIKKTFATPVFVTNCDILINADYGKVFSYHKTSGNAVTIVSALKNILVPYGVLHFKENGVVTDMEEKPKLSYFVNTGMYVMNPECIELIPDHKKYDMPELLELLMNKGKKVGIYPLSEDSFLDMGEFEELKRMEDKIKGQEYF